MQHGVPLLRASAPALQTSTLHPTITVTLCTKIVHVNDIEIAFETFRIEFSFAGPGYGAPLVYYCPRHILSPEYVRRTVEASLREEVMAWALGRPRVSSLMLETVSETSRDGQKDIKTGACRQETFSVKCDRY
ncbi:hypothetical protein M408DRAFT_325729 [Serendipita vermifera MAFF 305830]|uniref:Uncharacterized protein n=1 Tax=Serendipita vermifera MAFF 305830 TaxID=933852 RepID=A0A0C3BBT7_SERVB|nr:hypothetical protein M408DRAFT_325729 [Serendipita vermifera MAFF 305830]